MSELTCCPECDSANIQHNQTHQYKCWDCLHLFKEPKTRNRKNKSTPRVGLAGKLEAADPSEVTK